MRKPLAVVLLPLVLLTGCHVPGHVDEVGGPPVKVERQQQQNDGCPPPVAWARPGAGTVTDVKTCPGLFGTEVRYILVDSGPRQVWLADPAGACGVGDDWGPTTC